MLKVDTFESDVKFYGKSLANSFVHVAINNKLILSVIKVETFVLGDEETELPDYYETTYDIIDERGDVIYTTRFFQVVREIAIQMALTNDSVKKIVRFFSKRDRIFAQLRADNRTHSFQSSDRPVATILVGDEKGGWGTVVKGNKRSKEIHVAMYNSHTDIRVFNKKELALV